MYLDTLCVSHFKEKLADVIPINPDEDCNIFVVGPGGIRIHLSDRVIANFAHESVFTCEHNRGNAVALIGHTFISFDIHIYRGQLLLFATSYDAGRAKEIANLRLLNASSNLSCDT